MLMRPAAQLSLPPNSRAELKPGGVHLMLEGLKKTLSAGNRVPITFHFANSPPVRSIFFVQSAPIETNSATSKMPM